MNVASPAMAIDLGEVVVPTPTPTLGILPILGIVALVLVAMVMRRG